MLDRKMNWMWAACVGLTLVVAQPASAQSSFSQEAAAEVLFRDGAKLFAEGKLEQACAKFEASLQLDHALGTVLRLADCNDRVGKTASAWAGFQEAAALARTQQQTDREAIAQERADDLFERLSYLSVEIADETQQLDGVELVLNGSAIPRASWGTPIPVNPGPQSLEVRAPGYEPWSTRVNVPDAPGTQTATVPTLSPTPHESPGADGTPGVDGEQRAHEDAPEPRTSTQQLWGYLAGGVGLAALGAGGYFTYRAYDLNDQSLDHCLSGNSNACDSTGKALRDDARSNGDIATIAAAAGFTLIGVSAVLLLTAPDTESPVAHLELRTRATSASAGIELGGSW